MFEREATKTWLRTFRNDIRCRQFLAAAGVRQPHTYFARSHLPISTWLIALGMFADSRGDNESWLTPERLMRQLKIFDRKSATRVLSVCEKCYRSVNPRGFEFVLAKGGTVYSYEFSRIPRIFWGDKPYRVSYLLTARK